MKHSRTTQPLFMGQHNEWKIYYSSLCETQKHMKIVKKMLVTCMGDQLWNGEGIISQHKETRHHQSLDNDMHISVM